MSAELVQATEGIERPRRDVANSEATKATEGIDIVNSEATEATEALMLRTQRPQRPRRGIDVVNSEATKATEGY
jgi:hypothetical protein